MLLRHSLQHEDSASALEQAVFATWEAGVLTADLTSNNPVSTSDFTDSVINSITNSRAYPNTMLRYM